MLPPLTLEVMLLSKAWGGSRLAPWYRQSATAIGEAWLCSDLARTSGSGAGGQAMQSPIRGSTDTLHDVMSRDSEALLGYRADRFPLLLKFLDAAEPLSIQVHPSAAYAATHPDAHRKSEAWYVMESASGAELLLGSTSISSPSALRDVIADGTLPQQVTHVPAIAGQCCWLPSGLVHALGAGTLVFEVQTASDTTYRLYDWERELGRTGRPLHIDDGCDAVDLSLQPQWNTDDEQLAVTPDFDLRRIPTGAHRVDVLFGADRDARCAVLVPLAEGATLTDGTTLMPLPAHHATLVGAAHLGEWLVTTPPSVPLLAVRVA